MTADPARARTPTVRKRQGSLIPGYGHERQVVRSAPARPAAARTPPTQMPMIVSVTTGRPSRDRGRRRRCGPTRIVAGLLARRSRRTGCRRRPAAGTRGRSAARSAGSARRTPGRGGAGRPVAACCAGYAVGSVIRRSHLWVCWRDRARSRVAGGAHSSTVTRSMTTSLARLVDRAGRHGWRSRRRPRGSGRRRPRRRWCACPAATASGPTVMKNCEPLVPLPMRLPALAMASR